MIETNYVNDKLKTFHLSHHKKNLIDFESSTIVDSPVFILILLFFLFKSMFYKKRFSKNIVQKREQLVDYLIHNYNKKDLDVSTPSYIKKESMIEQYINDNKNIFPTDPNSFDYFFEDINDHIITFSCYNVQKRIMDSNDLYIDLDIDKSMQFNIENLTDLIEWYEWQFNHNKMYKINHEYNLNAILTFIKNNQKFLNPMYNDFEGIDQIRSKLHQFQNFLIKKVEEYYEHLIITREYNANNFNNGFNSAAIKKDNDIQKEIKEQNNVATYIEKETVEI